MSQIGVELRCVHAQTITISGITVGLTTPEIQALTEAAAAGAVGPLADKIVELSQKLGVTQVVMRAMLAAIGQADVPDEHLATKLEEVLARVRMATGQPSPSPIYYGLPDLPERYRPRSADTGAILDKLLGAAAGTVGITSVARAFGLHGMGGIGKTVLATALVHDIRVRTAFSDGIVWLTFGRQASTLAKAADLASALTGMNTSFATLAEARGQLGLYTAQRRLLVMLDDVWEPEAT